MVGREVTIYVPTLYLYHGGYEHFMAWGYGNAYNYGIGEPNYPVPAIPLIVDLTGDGIAVFADDPAHNNSAGFYSWFKG